MKVARGCEKLFWKILVIAFMAVFLTSFFYGIFVIIK